MYQPTNWKSLRLIIYTYCFSVSRIEEDLSVKEILSVIYSDMSNSVSNESPSGVVSIQSRASSERTRVSGCIVKRMRGSSDESVEEERRERQRVRRLSKRRKTKNEKTTGEETDVMETEVAKEGKKPTPKKQQNKKNTSKGEETVIPVEIIPDEQIDVTDLSKATDANETTCIQDSQVDSTQTRAAAAAALSAHAQKAFEFDDVSDRNEDEDFVVKKNTSKKVVQNTKKKMPRNKAQTKPKNAVNCGGTVQQKKTREASQNSQIDVFETSNDDEVEKTERLAPKKRAAKSLKKNDKKAKDATTKSTDKRSSPEKETKKLVLVEEVENVPESQEVKGMKRKRNAQELELVAGLESSRDSVPLRRSSRTAKGRGKEEGKRVSYTENLTEDEEDSNYISHGVTNIEKSPPVVLKQREISGKSARVAPEKKTTPAKTKKILENGRTKLSRKTSEVDQLFMESQEDDSERNDEPEVEKISSGKEGKNKKETTPMNARRSNEEKVSKKETKVQQKRGSNKKPKKKAATSPPQLEESPPQVEDTDVLEDEMPAEVSRGLLMI